MTADAESGEQLDSGGKSRGLTLLWLSASLAIAAWLVWRNRGEITFVSGMSPWLLITMVSAHAVGLITQAERFRIILQSHTKSALSIAFWMRLFVRGRLLSFAVPQSGHVYRGLALRQDRGTPGLKYLSGLVTQTWMSLVASLGFATLIAWAFVRIESATPARPVIAFLAVATVVVGFAPYAITRLWPILPRRLRSTRLARRAREAWALGVRTARSKALVAWFLGLVLLGLVTGGLGLKIAFSITGEDVGWVTAIGMLAFVHLGNVVSITPGNLGIQELGLAGLTTLVGYAPASGVLASAVLRLSNVAALVILILILEAGALTLRSSRLS